MATLDSDDGRSIRVRALQRQRAAGRCGGKRGRQRHGAAAALTDRIAGAPDLVGRLRGPGVGAPAPRRSGAAGDARARSAGDRARRDRLAPDRARRAAGDARRPRAARRRRVRAARRATSRSGGRRRSTAPRRWPTLLEAVGAENFVTAVVTDPTDWRPAAARPTRSGTTSSPCSTRSRPSPPATTCARSPPARQHAGRDGRRARPAARRVAGVRSASTPGTSRSAAPTRSSSPSGRRRGSGWFISRTSGRPSPPGSTRASSSLMEAVQDGLFAPLGDGDVPIAEVVTTLERQRLRRPVRARTGCGHHRRGTPCR